EVNLSGTINVLDAARRHGVARFVYASTGALYGAAGVGAPAPLDEERDRPLPESMYGITKYAAERTSLRPGHPSTRAHQPASRRALVDGCPGRAPRNGIRALGAS